MATSPARGLLIGALIGGGVVAAVIVGLRLYAAPPPPPVLAKVGSWTLTDDTNAQFGSEQLSGKIWVASFVFTRCLMSCPKITTAHKGVVSDVDAALNPKDAANIRFVSFSVDPKFDRPDVLTKYRAKYSLDKERWRLVTGETDAVFTLLRDRMFTHIGETKIHGDPAEGLIDIAHLERLAVFDQRGDLRATAEASAKGRAEVLNVIRALLAHPPAS